MTAEKIRSDEFLAGRVKRPGKVWAGCLDLHGPRDDLLRLPALVGILEKHVVPVVSYDIGAVSEMVEDGRSGFVVESRNIEQMTQRVAELIEQPDLLSSMSASARERFEREFTMTKFEARLRDYFAELIAKR